MPDCHYLVELGIIQSKFIFELKHQYLYIFEGEYPNWQSERQREFIKWNQVTGEFKNYQQQLQANINYPGTCST